MHLFFSLITLFLLLPATVSARNLSVPFTMQAPDGVWVQPWEDACEEATIAMVDAFYAGYTFDRSTAKTLIQRVVRLELNHFGFHRDTNAAQIAETINNFFSWEARVVDRPTLAEIQQEIDAGRPVILPVHGRSLKNPYFRDGGPDYHTVVISGYDDEKKEFIVQEPGTRRGLDFRYPYDRLLSAMHDFLPGNRTRFGKPIAVFTKKYTEESRALDGDNDGLSKMMELLYGSILWLSDSDGDGVSDGDEVRMGRLPTKK